MNRSLFTIVARAVYEEEDACHRSLFTIVARAVYEEEDACHRSLFTLVAEPHRPVELIDIIIL